MNRPVRKRTDADATETNQLDVTGIFCGKLLSCPAVIRAPGSKAKMRDPSGGTTGRVKLYGRLGWMGACAEYSLDGEGFTAPTYIGREGSPNVQTTCNFFIARRADWLREQPPCRKPWQHRARSSPWSWEPPDGPRLFQRDGCREPPRPAPPAR